MKCTMIDKISPVHLNDFMNSSDSIVYAKPELINPTSLEIPVILQSLHKRYPTMVLPQYCNFETCMIAPTAVLIF